MSKQKSPQKISLRRTLKKAVEIEEPQPIKVVEIPTVSKLLSIHPEFIRKKKQLKNKPMQ